MATSKSRPRGGLGCILLSAILGLPMMAGCSGEGETTVIDQPEDFKILTPEELAERNAERDRMMSGGAAEQDKPPGMK